MLLSATALAALVAGPVARAAVNLEWRPLRSVGVVGDIVEIGLFAVSDSGVDQPIAGLDLVFEWDGSHLLLLLNVDPCTAEPCPPNTYDWFHSGFPDDSALDGLNGTFADGDAFYTAFSQLGAGQAALATPEGLFVTAFRFGVLDVGMAEVRMIETCDGCTARTRVADGAEPAQEITGTLGLPAQVQIVQCASPTAQAIGARYLAVTPGPALDPVALLVEGEFLDRAVACVSLYVQADGRLGAQPYYLAPDDWGTVFVGDSAILPDTRYRVSTNCQFQAPAALSGAAEVKTWVWGDTDGDGDVGIDDVTRIADGAQGIFASGTLLENLDLVPCEPDGEIDILDVIAGQDAFSGLPFPCTEPCEGLTLDDLAEFVACMVGPGNRVTPGCHRFDFNGDRDGDLADFAAFQRMFTPGR